MCEREGAREGAREEGDFDRGLSEDLGKATKSADVKFVLATSESMSAPKRKKGLSFCISASAPGGGTLGAEGAFAYGLPLNTGVVESVVVESGKVEAAGKEGFSLTRGPLREISYGSENPPQTQQMLRLQERDLAPQPLALW